MGNFHDELTDLLKKDSCWQWTNDCARAFQTLKEAAASAPVLQLPDFHSPCKVHTNAFHRAIGGVLIQEKHPTTFLVAKGKFFMGNKFQLGGQIITCGSI